MELFKDLNPQQKEAVQTTEGPLLILAGAGSGKTKVLTHRIAYILDQKLASVDQILAVTFTNKAANEMRERIGMLLNGKPVTNILPWCGTFHSICVRILRRDGERIGLKRNFTIYDSNDTLAVVKEAMDRLGINKKETNPNAVKATISGAKNELITSSDYTKHADGFFAQIVATVYPVYQQILRENQAVDFDDLIMLTYQLFKNHTDLAEKYTERFRYVHIDEYQDTNKAQYELIKLLAQKNICVVGDDDQSIYGFRGADIRNILSFEVDFSGAKIIKLEQNYRSTQNILDASHAVVHKNQNRRDKKLWTEQSSGEKIHIHTSNDEVDEAQWVVEKCAEIVAQNDVDFRNMAILYRTNAQSRTIEEAFVKNEIPYKVVGSIRFYDRKEIKDLLAYMRIIANPSDDFSLERIVNIPRRGIGKKTFDNFKITAKSINLSLVEFLVNETDAIENKNIKNFAQIARDIVKYAQDHDVIELIKFILDRSGYIQFLDDGTLESQGRIENIQELISVAKKYEDLPFGSNIERLEKFLEDISLLEDQSKQDNPNSVTLMTIHASKGLEFDYIFLVGMEETIFPHSRSYADTKEMEEERRLAYVAITRAKKQIFVTHAVSRVFFGRTQSNLLSRFISDIPSDLKTQTSSVRSIEEDMFFDHYYSSEDNQLPTYSLNAKPGDLVKHEIFGKGQICELNESSVVVDFGPGKGKKELSIEFARLEKI